MTTRRDFIGLGTAAASVAAMEGFAAAGGAAPSTARTGGLKVRFLGTGAADWTGEPDARGEMRRFTSVLLDDGILVDFTRLSKDMIPGGAAPKTIFYTHSHGDHYDPAAAVDLGVEKVFCEEGWAKEASEEFARAAKSRNVSAPTVVPLKTGETVTVDGLSFTALPASHTTGRRMESALIYLIEKPLPSGDVRLLYATDTSTIVARAARLAGIDAHVRGRGITALVMEATCGPDHAEDYRLFQHAATGDVVRLVNVLSKTGRYLPHDPAQRVYVTHLARGLHPTQKELERRLPFPVAPAYDGLEVMFGGDAV